MAKVPELGLAHIRATGTRKHVAERQLALCNLVIESYANARSHKANPDASSFYCDDLRTELRTKNYKPLLAGLYEFKETNGKYSRMLGLTKQYRLRPHIRGAIDAVMQSGASVLVVDSKSGMPASRSSLPHSGIPIGVGDGRLFVPAVLDVPRPDDVTRAIGHVAQAIQRYGPNVCADVAKPAGCTLGELLQHLQMCRLWITSSMGGIPNTYKIQSSGRLGPSGGFHVIKLPSIVRHLLYDGSGLADYDIESAHFNIFRSCAHALGFATPCADAYVTRKAHYHQRWMNDTGHRCEADFKAMATSLLNGGSLSQSTFTETGRRLGANAVTSLQRDPFITALRQEAKDGMRRIIVAAMNVAVQSSKADAETNSDGETRTCTNAVGAMMHLQHRVGPRNAYSQSDFRKLCAHVLTGYEQWAIREVCTIASGLQVVIYDGFIAAPNQREALTAHLLRRSTEVLGFPLELRLKEAPFVTPALGDPDEF